MSAEGTLRSFSVFSHFSFKLLANSLDIPCPLVRPVPLIITHTLFGVSMEERNSKNSEDDLIARQNEHSGLIQVLVHPSFADAHGRVERSCTDASPEILRSQGGWSWSAVAVRWPSDGMIRGGATTNTGREKTPAPLNPPLRRVTLSARPPTIAPKQKHGKSVNSSTHPPAFAFWSQFFMPEETKHLFAEGALNLFPALLCLTYKLFMDSLDIPHHAAPTAFWAADPFRLSLHIVPRVHGGESGMRFLEPFTARLPNRRQWSASPEYKSRRHIASTVNPKTSPSPTPFLTQLSCYVAGSATIDDIAFAVLKCWCLSSIDPDFGAWTSSLGARIWKI
ncbi:hypothetical protein BDK51DRAFT_48962 [Blyttiomyces helicus]|uniref:Uncharacterized protein n=1 Tax=Blyttiomyces helicus TaxID=388810 RepID=A0A4P9WGV4_9FUNG|nr:hypothetical protein BDK51DRAFT_48962 [Blyttiomyces helicus]|eukprot:RKO91582.1 hypothetical protein BDK51DRAFT_48962 [Blyttiomyces helicus]